MKLWKRSLNWVYGKSKFLTFLYCAKYVIEPFKKRRFTRTETLLGIVVVTCLKRRFIDKTYRQDMATCFSLIFGSLCV